MNLQTASLQKLFLFCPLVFPCLHGSHLGASNYRSREWEEYNVGKSLGKYYCNQIILTLNFRTPKVQNLYKGTFMIRRWIMVQSVSNWTIFKITGPGVWERILPVSKFFFFKCSLSFFLTILWLGHKRSLALWVPPFPVDDEDPHNRTHSGFIIPQWAPHFRQLVWWSSWTSSPFPPFCVPFEGWELVVVHHKSQ